MRDSETPDGGAARERTVTEMESDADARAAAQAVRAKQATSILAEAEVRDVLADARDALADGRDAVASLDSFLRHDLDEGSAAHKARRAGALDRQDSKDDRAAAADDREQLTEDVSPTPDGDASVGSSN